MHIPDCQLPGEGSTDNLWLPISLPWSCLRLRPYTVPRVGLASMGTQLAEARGEGSLGGMAPLCPQPPHLPEGEEQPPACQHKREPCSGMRLPQGMDLHVPVQAQHVGFVAA